MTYRIVNTQFGYPLFAADVAGGPPWSDQESEAHVYDWRDNKQLKLAYWKADAARRGLDPNSVAIWEVVTP